MADDKYTFEQARIRLEEIAAEVRKKDTSLEKSLDLLEEGVRLANICTELVDHTDVGATVTAPRPNGAEDSVDEAIADDESAGNADESGAGDTGKNVDGFDDIDDIDDDVDELTDSGIGD